MDQRSDRHTSPGSSGWRRWVLVAGFGLAAASTTAFASEPCGTSSYPFPYTDVASVTDPFCPGIMEAYVTGVSKGTSPTLFSPNDTVIRLQMTTFLQRALDQGLARASRRAALEQWWVPQNTNAMQTITPGDGFCAADGEDIWATNRTGNQVVQVQANTGKVLGVWTMASSSVGVLAAAGKIFAVGAGNLYQIDPTLPPGMATSVATLTNNPLSIAFDGTRLWTADEAGSVSIITLQATTPYPVATVTGFSTPFGIVYDGAHIWVTDQAAGTLLKLDTTGAVLQTVGVGNSPGYPAFDGTNIWVPNANNNSITVVQASTGTIVATINADPSNNLNGPIGASFDGERVLVTNIVGSTVTLFKAADLSVIANVSTGASTDPDDPCSDGINFWVPLATTGHLLRF